MTTKRKLKVKKGSAIDLLRKKNKVKDHERWINLTQEGKDKRNEAYRERYKNPDYKYGKEYKREYGSEYYKNNKAYLDAKQVKKAHEKAANEILQYIAICNNLIVYAKVISDSCAKDKKMLARKQIEMKRIIKEHLYKLNVKKRTLNLSKKITKQFGLTADEIIHLTKKLQIVKK